MQHFHKAVLFKDCDLSLIELNEENRSIKIFQLYDKSDKILKLFFDSLIKDDSINGVIETNIEDTFAIDYDIGLFASLKKKKECTIEDINKVLVKNYNLDANKFSVFILEFDFWFYCD